MSATNGHDGRVIDLYRDLVEKSLDVMLFFRTDGTILHANTAALQSYGYTLDEIRTKSFSDIRSPQTRDLIASQLERARDGSFRFETVHRRKDGSEFVVEATWSISEMDGEAVVLSVIRDISDKVSVAEALRESERQLSDFFETAAVPMHWVGPDGTILRANQAELELLGYTREEYLGRHIAEFHADRPTIEDILTRLTCGETIRDYPARLRRKDDTVLDVQITSSVLFEEGEFRHTRCLTTDVTDRLRAERELHASEERFRMLVEHSANIIWRTGPDGRYLGRQESFERFTGLPYETYSGDGGLSAVHPDDVQRVTTEWQEALATGEPFQFEYRLRNRDGEYRHTFTRGTPLLRDDGSVREWVGYVEDITERKAAEAEKAELLASEAGARREAETLNELARSLAAELDLTTLVQRVTDAATSLTGAAFGAFFYNVLNNAGESYMLYTLSGVPRSAFENFPMPRNTPIFAPTFNGEGVVRMDDVTKDPRYGTMAPHYGMPKGHLPVRSYLAAPVISRSGEVLGGLFFGHSKIGVFKASHERMIVGLAAHTAVAMDNARLYAAAQKEIEQRQLAEAELRGARDVLEDTVAERTAELRKLALDLQAEVEVRKGAETRLRQLMTRLVNIQEEERRRIGRNIHDHLGQQLTGLRINLANLESQTADMNHISDLARKIQTLAEELDSSIDFVTWELIPGDIATVGLPSALRELVNAWSRRFDIMAEFNFRGPDAPDLPENVSSNLYRITQEALHNIVKHAHASRADVLFEIDDAEVKLIVEDDGGGFAPERNGNGSHSLGLISMRERASALDGTFEIESTPGNGTTIFVRVPLVFEPAAV